MRNPGFVNLKVAQVVHSKKLSSKQDLFAVGKNS